MGGLEGIVEETPGPEYRGLIGKGPPDEGEVLQPGRRGGDLRKTSQVVG